MRREIRRTGKRRIGRDKQLLKRSTAAIFVIFTLAISYLPGTPSWDDIYAAVGLFPSPQNYDLEDLNVFFLDVGQGDSILIYTEDTSILLDTGPKGNEQKIYNLLKTLKVESLDYLIITHQHDDHNGSQKALEKLMPITNEIIPNKTTKMAGMTLDLKDISLKFLGPVFVSDNLNNMSLVIKLSYKDTSFLFMADAEEDEEGSLLRTYSAEDLHADVLKVGHHGSESSSAPAFIKTVNPQFAVISVGKDNDYGHPHKQTLDTLKGQNINIFRTDRDGDILFTTNGETIRFSLIK